MKTEKSSPDEHNSVQLYDCSSAALCSFDEAWARLDAYPPPLTRTSGRAFWGFSGLLGFEIFNGWMEENADGLSDQQTTNQ